MLRVMRNHRYAAYNSTENYENLEIALRVSTKNIARITCFRLPAMPGIRLLKWAKNMVTATRKPPLLPQPAPLVW
jgi:hypothetical protein